MTGNFILGTLGGVGVPYEAGRDKLDLLLTHQDTLSAGPTTQEFILL